MRHEALWIREEVRDLLCRACRSAKKAVQIGFESGCREIEANPNRTIILGGYSLRAIVAAMLRAALEPGGRLTRFRQNYVCGFSIGDPARPFGASYFLGPILAGQGISAWRMPQECVDYSWCWLTHPDDMYGNIPLGVPATSWMTLSTS